MNANGRIPKPLFSNSNNGANNNTPVVNPTSVKPVRPTKPAPLVTNGKKTPKPAFKSTGFDVHNIDQALIPAIKKHGDFNEAEQARICYIVNTDFSDIYEKKNIKSIEQQTFHSQKSHEILLKCLQNNLINDVNTILAAILHIIKNAEKEEDEDSLWDLLFSSAKEENIQDTTTIISILDVEADKLKTKLPLLQNMVSSLDDALFHTTQEYKTLRLYYIAGECKINQLGNFTQNRVQTSDPIVLMRQVDEKHNYNLFLRKVDNLKVLVEYITSSLMQAQVLQNVLESMLEKINTMLHINIPAFKQQLLYANSFKSIKNSPEYVTQRSTLVNNITSILDNVKN